MLQNSWSACRTVLETQTPNVHTKTKTETEPCSVHPVAAKPGSVTQNGGWPGVGDGSLADLWQHSTNSHQTSTGHRDVLQGVQHLLEVLASCGLRTMATPPVGPWDINESSTAGANLAATWLKVQKTQVESQPSMQYACQLFAKHWKTATCLPGFLVVFRWMCICLPDSNGGVINEDNHLMSLLRT